MQSQCVVQIESKSIVAAPIHDALGVRTTRVRRRVSKSPPIMPADLDPQRGNLSTDTGNNRSVVDTQQQTVLRGRLPRPGAAAAAAAAPARLTAGNEY